MKAVAKSSSMPAVVNSLTGAGVMTRRGGCGGGGMAE